MNDRQTETNFFTEINAAKNTAAQLSIIEKELEKKGSLEDCCRVMEKMNLDPNFDPARLDQLNDLYSYAITLLARSHFEFSRRILLSFVNVQEIQDAAAALKRIPIPKFKKDNADDIKKQKEDYKSDVRAAIRNIQIAVNKNLSNGRFPKDLNQRSMHIKLEILKGKTFAESLAVIKRFIKIMEECLALNDLHSVAAICSALDSNFIIRIIGEEAQCLSDKLSEIRQETANLMDPKLNFKQLRKFKESKFGISQYDIVPHTGLLSQEFAFLAENEKPASDVDKKGKETRRMVEEVTINNCNDLVKMQDAFSKNRILIFGSNNPWQNIGHILLTDIQTLCTKEDFHDVDLPDGVANVLLDRRLEKLNALSNAALEELVDNIGHRLSKERYPLINSVITKQNVLIVRILLLDLENNDDNSYLEILETIITSIKNQINEKSQKLKPGKSLKEKEIKVAEIMENEKIQQWIGSDNNKESKVSQMMQFFIQNFNYTIADKVIQLVKSDSAKLKVLKEITQTIEWESFGSDMNVRHRSLPKLERTQRLSLKTTSKMSLISTKERSPTTVDVPKVDVPENLQNNEGTVKEMHKSHNDEKPKINSFPQNPDLQNNHHSNANNNNHVEENSTSVTAISSAEMPQNNQPTEPDNSAVISIRQRSNASADATYESFLQFSKNESLMYDTTENNNHAGNSMINATAVPSAEMQQNSNPIEPDNSAVISTSPRSIFSADKTMKEYLEYLEVLREKQVNECDFTFDSPETSTQGVSPQNDTNNNNNDTFYFRRNAWTPNEDSPARQQRPASVKTALQKITSSEKHHLSPLRKQSSGEKLSLSRNPSGEKQLLSASRQTSREKQRSQEHQSLAKSNSAEKRQKTVAGNRGSLVPTKSYKLLCTKKDTNNKLTLDLQSSLIHQENTFWAKKSMEKISNNVLQIPETTSNIEDNNNNNAPVSNSNNNSNDQKNSNKSPESERRRKQSK